MAEKWKAKQDKYRSLKARAKSSEEQVQRCQLRQQELESERNALNQQVELCKDQISKL